MDAQQIIGRLATLADTKSVEGMRRFGICPDAALGVRIPRLRALAREIGRDHRLALQLWEEKLRETMILASMVAQVGETSPEMMERWAADFYDWEVTDQTCMNLFEKTPFVGASSAARRETRTRPRAAARRPTPPTAPIRSSTSPKACRSM